MLIPDQDGTASDDDIQNVFCRSSTNPKIDRYSALRHHHPEYIVTESNRRIGFKKPHIL
jgi:hypothetical protein